MECPKCRREIILDFSPSELVFCPYCGENITSPSPDRFSFCSSCGLKLPAEAVFCPRCGIKMSAPENFKVVREQPKQHIPSREDITELVSSKVAEPAAEAQPKIIVTKTHPKPTGEPLWPKIKAWVGKSLEPLRDFVSGQWRVRRLYRKWARDGVFSREEIPSAESLNQITREAGGQPMQPTRLILIIVAALVFVAFFVIIGITMSQCK